MLFTLNSKTGNIQNEKHCWSCLCFGSKTPNRFFIWVSHHCRSSLGQVISSNQWAYQPTRSLSSFDVKSSPIHVRAWSRSHNTVESDCLLLHFQVVARKSFSLKFSGVCDLIVTLCINMSFLSAVSLVFQKLIFSATQANFFHKWSRQSCFSLLVSPCLLRLHKNLLCWCCNLNYLFSL